MLQISNTSKVLCGISLMAVPAIEYGGVRLLRVLLLHEDRFKDNAARQALSRAGHAHAGMMLILSLICQILADSINLPQAFSWFIRIGVLTGSILVPLGFLVSAGSPPSEQPEGGIQLSFAGNLILAVSLLSLGTGLILSAL